MLQRERPDGEKWGSGAHKPQISSARAAHTPPDHNLKRAKARVQVDNGGGFSFYPLKRSGLNFNQLQFLSAQGATLSVVLFLIPHLPGK